MAGVLRQQISVDDRISMTSGREVMNDSIVGYSSSSVFGSLNKPEDACKIFVGGLSWDTTQEKLNSYFGQFGEVVDCILMMDTSTKRSRGFGFVTYRDPASVLKVLDSGPHILDNKSIDPKAAVPRFPNQPTQSKVSSPISQTSPPPIRRCNKIFVGGIGQATEDDLRFYFTSFGTVTDVTIMMDKTTGRPRGFAFVGFESSEASEQTVMLRYHTIKGKRVEVKLAQPRDSRSIDGTASDDSCKIENDVNGSIFNLNGFHQLEDSRKNSRGFSKGIKVDESTVSQCEKNIIFELLDQIWK